jgi:hypothetical protein
MANAETKSLLGTLYSTKTSKTQKHNTENYKDEQRGLLRKTGMNPDVGASVFSNVYLSIYISNNPKTLLMAVAYGFYIRCK